MTFEELKQKSMGELNDLLSHCEKAQYNIEDQFIRAAQMQPEMRELKKEEKFIRAAMMSKVSSS